MWLFWIVVITVRVRFEWNISFTIMASSHYLKKWKLDQAYTLDRDLGNIAPNVLENISLVMAENP